MQKYRRYLQFQKYQMEAKMNKTKAKKMNRSDDRMVKVIWVDLSLKQVVAVR